MIDNNYNFPLNIICKYENKNHKYLFNPIYSINPKYSFLILTPIYPIAF